MYKFLESHWYFQFSEYWKGKKKHKIYSSVNGWWICFGDGFVYFFEAHDASKKEINTIRESCFFHRTHSRSIFGDIFVLGFFGQNGWILWGKVFQRLWDRIKRQMPPATNKRIKVCMVLGRNWSWECFNINKITRHYP